MITKDQAAEHLDTLVDVINVLAAVVGGKTLHSDEAIAHVTKAVINALSDRLQGDVDADTVKAHLAKLHENLAAHDTAADAALHAKFDVVDDGEG